MSLAQSTTWSSHSPAALPPPRSRASWPSAESKANPRASAAQTASPRPHEGAATATRATAAKLRAALISVTWFGVSPSAYEPAARYRPTGRLTNRE